MARKIFVAIAAGMFLIALILGAMNLSQKKSPNPANGKIKIIATIFPLYDMARHIGGEKADVSMLLPPGMEAHSFEPTAGDILKINEADIFIYTADTMEPWAKDLLAGVGNKNLSVVYGGDGATIIRAVFHDSDATSAFDPHIWLDFGNAKIMAQNIASAMEKKDPANATYYVAKAQDYENKLTQLDVAYKNELSNCVTKDIFYGGHYAFGYLANRYGLKYVAVQGVSPDAEPTAADISSFIDQVKKQSIRYIFYEELTSPKLAETIAKETDAKLLLLNAAHNLSKDQFAGGITFFEIMMADLNNLKIGLGCR
jgi:zinc transport system substrate-binding protein